ncbi:MAG: T9SS type A sorting domain-containing protein [Prevotellaceae bacterium]|nr:T9SS type A sorting domain-containing protein [Prevotellaceae bacterium]
MRKNLLTSVVSAGLLAFSTNVVAQTFFTTTNKNSTDIMPKCIQEYSTGDKNRSLESFLKANSSESVVPDNVERTVVFSEDFSKWTAGSESEPDEVDVTQNQETFDALMNVTGWSGLMAYQAGGYAYLGWDEVGDDGPGYLMTPIMDLRGESGQGVYLLKIRAKSVNPTAETQTLQTWSFNEGTSSLINASPAYITTEWTECEYLLSGGVEKTSIMFYGNSGKVLIDEMQIFSLTYPLNTPKVSSFALTDAAQFTVKWSAIEGATSYYVYITNNDLDITVAEAEVTTNEAVLNMDTAVDPEVYYSVRVVAKNSEGESYEGGATDIFDAAGEMTTPVALAATNVSENGFTANWEASTFARQYGLNMNHTHTATADAEEYVYLDEDFSLVPESATAETPLMMMLCSLDKYLQWGGWTADLAVFMSNSMILTNIYSSYGLTGKMVSPQCDFSVGNGTVNVSISGYSAADDFVVGIYFMDENGDEIEGSRQSMEFAPYSPSTQTVSVTGGKQNSNLVIEIEDAAETGDMLLISGMNISTTLNMGETVDTYRYYYVDYPQTSYTMEAPLSDADKYSYSVLGYFSDDYMSDLSNVVSVDYSTAIKSLKNIGNAKVYSSEGNIVVENSDAEVSVYSIDGRKVADFNTVGTKSISLPKGMYIVKSGNETYKVMNK